MCSIVKKAVALILLVTPLTFLGVMGFAFLALPPRSRPKSPWLAVASVSQIPVDGGPVFLPIMAPRYDAWTRLSDEKLGHVFARRDLITNEIKVVSALHGHLSAPVVYDRQTGCFVSRCFDVRFDLDGTVIQDRSGKFSNRDSMHSVDFTMVGKVLFVRNPQS